MRSSVSTPRKSRLAFIGAAIFAIGALTSCSNGPTAEGSTQRPSDTDVPATYQEARALLPEDVADAGTLAVASNLSYTPYSFKDEGGNPAGIDIEIITEVTNILGLEPEIYEVAFASIIPAIQNGRFDVGVNEIADTAERREAVSFVDYWRLEFGVLAGKSAPADWTDSADICGRHFGQTSGSAQERILEDLGDKCQEAGEPRPKVDILPDTGATFLALENGRVEAFLSDKGSSLAYERENKDLKSVRTLDGVVDAPIMLAGIAFNKENEDLGEAIAAALRIMHEEGSYAAILEQYGLTESNGLTLDQIGINGG